MRCLWQKKYLFDKEAMHKTKLKIFITIDVEHGIGGAFSDVALKPIDSNRHIFCQIGNNFYGIPLIIDILNKNKIKASFFVETANKYFFGEDETRQACRYIVDKGQDVQLHLHPNYKNFENNAYRKFNRNKKLSDLMAHYSLSEQTNLVKEGKDLLQKYGAPSVIAFRAGCFGANNQTLEALKNNGIVFDSSYSYGHLGSTCFLDRLGTINDGIDIEGIREFPVTHFQDFCFLNYHRLKLMDISGVSFFEIKKALFKALRQGTSFVTIILHSFSFVKAKDNQYRNISPNYIAINRFKDLCAFLSKNNDYFEALSFSDYYQKYFTSEKDLSPHHDFPYVGPIGSVPRKLIQVFNHYF
jgi:hypothetical protein